MSNRLTNKQWRDVANYLEELAVDGVVPYNAAELSTHLTKNFECDVSKWIVRSMCKELGIAPKRQRAASGSQVQQQLAAVEASLTAIAAAQDLLAERQDAVGKRQDNLNERVRKLEAEPPF